MDLNPDTVGQASCRKNEASPRMVNPGGFLFPAVSKLVYFTYIYRM